MAPILRGDGNMRRIFSAIITTAALGFSFGILPLNVSAQTLGQAVQHAIDHNPDVGIDVAKRHAFDAQIDQAKAGYLPQINLNAGIGSEHSVNPTSFAIGAGSDVNLRPTEAGISLEENLFRGFNTYNEVQRTSYEARAAAFTIAGVADELSLNVTEQYLDVLLQRRLVVLARSNVSAHRDIFEMIKFRKLAGVAREAEMYQGRSRIALARANFIAVESRLDDAKTKFKRFVKASPRGLTMPRVPRYPTLPRTEHRAVALALKDHPTLKSAQADIAATIAQHNASKSTDYPIINFIAEANRDRNTGGIRGRNDNDLFMFRAHYNIFAGGADMARQRETAYEVQEAMEIRNRTILQIDEAVALAYTSFHSAQKRERRLRHYMLSARQTLDAYREQFKLGKRTLLDLLDSQNEYYTARVEYTTARFDVMFSRYRILNAMGTLPEYLRSALPEAAQVIGPVDVTHRSFYFDSGHRDDSLTYAHHAHAASQGQPHMLATEKHVRNGIKSSKYGKSRSRRYSKNGGHKNLGYRDSKKAMLRHDSAGYLRLQSSKASGSKWVQTGEAGNARSLQLGQAEKVARTIRAETRSNAARRRFAAAQKPMFTGRGDDYTIQLLALTDLDSMKRFVARHHLQGKTTYYRTRLGQQSWYVLVYGRYPSSAAAKKAIDALPGSLAKSHPWVRTYASVQKEINSS